MLFGSHVLSLTHRPSLFSLSFRATDALRFVDSNHAEEGVQVEAAGVWKRGASGTERANMQIIRPYDWTFTPWGYKGISSKVHVPPDGGALKTDASDLVDGTPLAQASACAEGATSKQTDSSPNLHEFRPCSGTSGATIDYALLSRRDPILFFDEIPLYEDELSDNGSTALFAKVRVMQHSLLILLRHFLRIDNVLFRITDTRVFITFQAPAGAPPFSQTTPANVVVREHRVSQVPYDAVRMRLCKPARVSGTVHARPNQGTPARNAHYVTHSTSVSHTYTPQPVRSSSGRTLGPVSSFGSPSVSPPIAADEEEEDRTGLTDRDRVTQFVEEILDEVLGRGLGGRMASENGSVLHEGGRGGPTEFWRIVEREELVVE
ncbi:TIP41-domain-containing protein [Gonapodya prolifera JEL478]|uniref:TIP41-domain-containing protein n=1 Tax=Gonapodya prolifera (strain JEL478) TaxID=1344416 RepID=A0A139AV02_GONPJ|nr:TIP41-domain-containing protein [Gonapodya prolifera JEL478]|eukprot:KXS20529.1 TIP41-domain-containing protein [Gonapodya prolifera JEL478]